MFIVHALSLSPLTPFPTLRSAIANQSSLAYSPEMGRGEESKGRGVKKIGRILVDSFSPSFISAIVNFRLIKRRELRDQNRTDGSCRCQAAADKPINPMSLLLNHVTARTNINAKRATKYPREREDKKGETFQQEERPGPKGGFEGTYLVGCITQKTCFPPHSRASKAAASRVISTNDPAPLSLLG